MLSSHLNWESRIRRFLNKEEEKTPPHPHQPNEMCDRERWEEEEQVDIISRFGSFIGDCDQSPLGSR